MVAPQASSRPSISWASSRSTAALGTSGQGDADTPDGRVAGGLWLELAMMP